MKLNFRAAVVALLVASAAAPALASPVALPAAEPVHTDRARSETLTSVADVRRGSMVTIQGVVSRIVDTDEFVLADATGQIRVDVGYPNFVPVSEGEAITVRGFVDRGIFRELYAREIVHADGRLSRLDRRAGYK